jgi:hypothetical protein
MVIDVELGRRSQFDPCNCDREGIKPLNVRTNIWVRLDGQVNQILVVEIKTKLTFSSMHFDFLYFYVTLKKYQACNKTLSYKIS